MAFKVSSAPEDAFHMSGKFADGWGVITDAKAVIFQFPPTKEAKGNRQAGQQDPPALYCELTIQRYNNGDGDKSASPPEQKLLGMCKPSPDTGTVDALHVGNYPDGDTGQDPEEVGAGNELGCEGNTVLATQDGYQFNDKCGWMVFAASLVEDGFKPLVLKRTYFPDLIGLYAYFETVTMPKFRADQTDDPTAFRIKKGTTKFYPYEKKTAAPAARGKAAPAGKTAAGAAAAKPRANGPVAPANQPDLGAAGDVEDIATAILTETFGPAKKGQPPLNDLRRLKLEVLTSINQHKPAVPAGQKKAVMDRLSDMEWVQSVGVAYDLFQVEADGKVAFTA